MDSDELRRKFGARLQKLREERKLTQEKLAEKIDRTVYTIGNIERGINSTRIETLYAIAKALGVSMADLFDIVALPSKPLPKSRKSVDRLVELVSRYDDITINELHDVVKAALRLKRLEKP